MDPIRLDLLVENHLGRIAHIFVVTSTTSQRGHTYISPECRSVKEVEYSVELLKRELDAILAKARREFSKSRPPLDAAPNPR